MIKINEGKTLMIRIGMKMLFVGAVAEINKLVDIIILADITILPPKSIILKI